MEVFKFTPITVTTRRQVPVFPASSVDEQFKVVSPIRYVSWDEWEQVTSRWKSTLSVAVEFSRTVDDELSPLIRSRKYIWAVQNRCFSICRLKKQTYYISTYSQELYNACQRRGDDIMKRNRYRVEKIIVRNIWFFDNNFFSHDSKC